MRRKGGPGPANSRPVIQRALAKRDLRQDKHVFHGVYIFIQRRGNTSLSSVYGLQSVDLLVMPPTLTTETAPTYNILPNCPLTGGTANWIFVNWDTGTNVMTNTYLFGTATYSSSGSVDVTTQYDVTGALYYQGSVSLGAGSCNGGSVSGGTMYFALDGSGFTRPRRATPRFSFPNTR